MADAYALLRDDGSLLYARRQGGQWSLSSEPVDAGARGSKLSIFVPGTDVAAFVAPLPSRNDREARLAAPYAIEDDIAEAVESLHVALGPLPAQGETERMIQAVSQEQMDVWLSDLETAGHADASIIAAHTLLPEGDLLCETGDLVLGRLSGRTFALDRSIGADVFIGLTEAAHELRVYGHGLAAAMNRTPEADGLNTDAALLRQLIEWAEAAVPVNLRQGKFRVRQPVNLDGLNRWRLMAAMASLAVFAWFAGLLLQTHGLNQRTAVLEARTVEFVNAGWPEAGGQASRIVSTSVNAASAGVEFPSALTIMAVLYEAIEAVPDTELRSVRYDRTRGQMTARISFADYNRIDLISAQIEEAGLSVNVGDARQSGAMIVGELTMEAQP
ncbi:MAG: type II secretion system protein GspL [Pseudomonadota bacterium]